jgi:hypothetical protein
MSAVTSFSPPAETCTAHVLHGEGRSESKGKGRRVYLETPQSSSGGQRWCGGSSGAGGAGGGGGSSSSVFSSSFLSVFLFFLPLKVFFFSSFSVLSPFSLYSLSYLFLCPLSSVFSAPSFFLVLSPVFIGKTGEREAGGSHCTAAPKTARVTHLIPILQHVESFGQVGLVSVFLRESWRWKTEEEKKSSSSPASCVQGKKKTYGAVQNDTVFSSSSSFGMNSR